RDRNVTGVQTCALPISGAPIWPVEERAVPQGAVDGERLSPTQPFPTHLPPLLAQRFTSEDIFRVVPRFVDSSCEDQLAPLRNDEIGRASCRDRGRVALG